MLRRSLPILVAALLIAGCSSDGGSAIDTSTSTSAVTTTTGAASTTTEPTTIEGKLAAAYPDPDVDPSAEAWQALRDDPTLADTPLSVIEFAGIADDAGRAQYTEYVEAMRSAVATVGGQFEAVTDIWHPALEQPQGFDGGMAWSATFPSRDAFLEAVLDPAVVEAAASRRLAVIDPHLFVGVNIIPQFILDLEIPTDVEALPHDLVRGRDTSDVVDELLSIYQDGGPDPTRASLEAMLARDDVRTQAVTYINMYQFGPDTGGAESITEYNTNALPFVLAHGARPKVIFDVAQQLLGSVRWDRVIIVRWPSIEVFTDLRLTPGYIEAQTSRVESSQVYGNLITINRAD